MTDKTHVGRAERVALPDLQLSQVPAKVDTGADSSSIWVSQAEEKPDGLHCVFFGPGSEFYTGRTVCFEAEEYTLTRVANSFGEKEYRFKLKLRVTVKGRTVRSSFTLSDRSAKTYPILLGRRLLSGKFLVDVSAGEPLTTEERAKAERLKQELRTAREKKNT